MQTTIETRFEKKDNGLSEMVRSIAHTINSGERDNETGGELPAFDWMCDALDIRWIVDNDLNYLGAEVLVAFGGPNVWVKTIGQKVEGFWWGDYAKSEYQNDPMGLDDYLRELYESRMESRK
jgi:hypothetical protein